MSAPEPDTNRDITVVITCFNYGAYLPEAVSSALGQEGGPPHVTVVDDGSTEPQTLQELDRLPPAVKLIRQSNAGSFSGAERGVPRREDAVSDRA